MRDPIVVTGMGVVSPRGCSVEGMWQRLITSQSGLGRLPEDIVPDIDAKVAGIVASREGGPDGFDPDDLIPVKDRRKMDRFTEPDEAALGMDLIGLEARRTSVEYGLSNGFGFGGVNASTVLKRGPSN